MKLRLLAFALLALLAAVTPARGQSQAINGTIEGTVTDEQGGVLPGVTVVLTHNQTSTSRTVVTNASGLYRVPLLSLGTFTVTYELSGFGKQERTNVTLNAGQTAVVNVALGVGTLGESVTVTGEAVQVDSAKTDVGRNLTAVEIQNLPNVARNPLNFALLEPGVTGFENEEFGVPRFAVNGQMLRVNYQIDGSTNTQKDRAGLRMMPISDVMIREVQVVSAGYAPEFGQTTGMVYNAVTPSGSNALTGDLGFRFRTKDFAAWPFSADEETRQDPSLKPDNSLNIVTVAVGGPVKRNHLFFYGGYEYTRQDLPRQSTIDPDVAAQIGLAPQPIFVDSYRATPMYIAKLDWQASGAHRISWRTNTFTNDNPWQSGGGNTAIERGNNYNDAMLSTAVQAISSFGASRLNELRIQYAKRTTTREPAMPGTTGPSVTISGSATQNAISFGPYTNIGQGFEQSNLQLVDNLTLLRGNHSYKVGVDAQWVFDVRSEQLPTSYTFPNTQAYLDAVNGVNPYGYTSFSQTLGDPDFEMTNTLVSWFVQDDWKVSSSFKLLYGVRHDMYIYPDGIAGSPYSEKFNRDYNNVAPRFGATWQIDDRSLLRGSTGINYDQPLLAIIERAFASSGLPSKTTSVNLGPTSSFAPAFPSNLSALPPGAVQVSSTIEGMAPDFQTAHTWQNNLTYERELGRNYSFSVGARHSRGYGLPVITDVNLAGVTPVRYLEDGRGVYSSAINATTRNDPRFNRVRLVQSIGKSWYKGLTLGFNKRWANFTQFNLNYTWGSGEDTAPLGGGVLAVQGDSARADPANLAIDKGPNQLDIRHTFTGSIVAMSSVKRFSPWVNALLSDNQIGMMILINSGQPDGLAGNRDLNFDGYGNDRPLFITRNSMTAPVRPNFDMRLSRFIALGGGRRAEIQLEAKNIFNIEQVTGISNTIAIDADGYPLDAAGVRQPLDSISLDTADYISNGWREQRKLQLGFKFQF